MPSIPPPVPQGAGNAADRLTRAGSGRLRHGFITERTAPLPRAYCRTSAVSTDEGVVMADKSPKKSAGKTSAAKTLKEKRVDKKDKAAAKRKAE